MRLFSVLGALIMAAGAIVTCLHVPVAAQQPLIDYKSLSTNQDKLAACESLIGQAIAEYNRQSDLSAANESRYALKFYTYICEHFHPIYVQLLSERDELRTTIRRGLYSDSAWAGASPHDVDEATALAFAMYGNTTDQQKQETIAVCSSLETVKTIELSDLKDSFILDPTEDYTTYTEYDEAGYIAVDDANTITADSAQTRYKSYWVYDDKGANHFDGDFTHRVEILVSARASQAYRAVPWMLANTAAADSKDIEDASGDYLHAMTTYSVSDKAFLLECDGGSVYWSSDVAVPISTRYYFTIERDEAVGTYGSLYNYICTTNYYGESGSSLEGTCTLTLHSKEDFRYVYAISSYDTDTSGYSFSGTIENLDLQELGVPTVDTDAADDLEDTTATLNGEVIAIGDSIINTRAFAWDTSSHGDPGSGTSPYYSDYAYSWNQTGTYGTGVFDHGVTSLASATTHYFRAAARNDNTLWDYGDELTFLTKPAAPTNVAATDGVHTDKVVVTWTKSSGTVTGYKIYRDGGLIDTVGDVATYDDTGADAPTITAGSAVATDGTYTDKVNISVTGDSANPGTTHTYKVRAYNDTGDSDDSGTDTGYRGVGSLTYQWYRSFGCASSNYSALGGGTTDPYDDMTAPSPVITANNATACDGCSSAFVTVSSNESVANGVCRYYHAVLAASGATSQNSTSDSGYRGTTTLTYQWWRSWADSAANYTQIAGATTDPYNDSGGAAEPDGRYYLVTVAMSGASSANSSADRGYMSSGNITAVYVYPEWQSRFVGLNGTVWAVAWAGHELAINESVSWNTSGVGGILWCENVTGADGRADCRITSNASGNQTIGCSGGAAYDEGICLWVDDSPADLPTWYFAILGVAIVGAWFTKEIILYVMATVACAGMVWWVQNSTLDGYTVAALSAIFIMLGGVMIFGMLRRGEFSFVRGGDSE